MQKVYTIIIFKYEIITTRALSKCPFYNPIDDLIKMDTNKVTAIFIFEYITPFLLGQYTTL